MRLAGAGNVEFVLGSKVWENVRIWFEHGGYGLAKEEPPDKCQTALFAPFHILSFKKYRDRGIAKLLRPVYCVSGSFLILHVAGSVSRPVDSQGALP